MHATAEVGTTALCGYDRKNPRQRSHETAKPRATPGRPGNCRRPQASPPAP